MSFLRKTLSNPIETENFADPVIVQNRSLQTRSIHSSSELASWIDPWRSLAAGAPMRSPEWLLGWWDAFAESGDELHILLVLDTAGSLVGLAPMYRQGRERAAIFRVLGAREHCTHHTDWLSLPGWESAVGREVARYLLRCRQEWTRLWFEAVDVDAEAIQATLTHLTEEGCLRHRRPINNGWRVSLPDTWEEYLQILSRSLRKRCRKLQREFFDSGRIRLRQVETEADLREGFEVLLKLHAARWGTTGHPLGVFSDPKFRVFHERVSRALLAEGKLRLAWLEYEGRPAAVEYQFLDRQALYAYQAGLDLSLDGFSPGKLSMMAAIQSAISRGCHYFDLLGGDEPYKAHWRAFPIPRHDIRVWQGGLGGHLEWVAWSGYTLAVHRLKRILPHRLVTRGLHLASAVKSMGIFRQAGKKMGSQRMSFPMKAMPLARGAKHALLLLARGKWREFLIRLRIASGQIDLKNDLSERVTDRTHYYADSGGVAFDQIMDHFDIQPGDAIVDFGCGKGGVLISLSKYPFSRITGVEISPELSVVAEKNIRTLKLRNIDVVCCDAAEFRYLDDYNYFYFFDPFPAVVMQEVLRNIEESLARVPREATIIYLNPFCHELIESRGRFARVMELPHFEHECFVYSNVS